MSRRPGFTLVETVAALAAGVVACALALAVVEAQRRLDSDRAHRLQRLETVRIAATLLRAEAAPLVPAADVAAVAADSLAIRLFRGLGVTCAPATDGSVLVRYRGAREPDPAKDSLQSLGDGEPVVPLLGSTGAASACPGEGRLLRWTLPGAPAVGTPFLVFERGTYALSSGALRLRRGRAGRQPLTEELLGGHGNGFFVSRPADAPAGSPAAIVATLDFADAPLHVRLRLPLLNTASRGGHP